MNTGTACGVAMRDAPRMASPSFAVRDLRPDDHARLLALNAASVDKLSPLDAHRLGALLDETDVALVAVRGDTVAGFVLALREGAGYASPNYRWFAARYRRFLYVDRVVVDADARGVGIGRSLYDAVFERARRAGIARVACEYDVEPPNPESARFHAACGFREVGTQGLDGGKRVSLQLADAWMDRTTAANCSTSPSGR